MITYSSPIITEDPNRPIPYANKGFPYQGILDPRRYEELIYSLYKHELGLGIFKDFDSISLLSGTSDKGMDCVLVKNNKNHGLIQCKRYEKNLSKDEVGLEITKFAMYSLIYSDLIYDPTDFIYFIASSRGFANGCITFLNHFNEQISKEEALDKWISRLITNPDLQTLSFLPVKEKVLSVLEKISVKMISSNDLDYLLVQKKNSSIAKLFFQVRTVIDSSGIIRLEKKLDYILQKKLSGADIISQLTLGSSTIGHEKNYFEGISNSHIERAETNELLTWITGPIERSKDGAAKNICLLAGNAGLGKTVIIRDAYEKLTKQGIPVLALKADKIYAANIRELQDKIGIGMSIQQLVEDCLEYFPNLVIMIDQIDALSQALSANPEFLNTYKQLISFYKNRENIRIVISVRLFDLYYDPGLRVYKDLKSIEVQPISTEVLIPLLERMGFRKRQLSQSLLSLLQIPNNLDVFSRLYKKGDELSSINSLQDLYTELYNIKILKPVVNVINASKLKTVLNLVVQQMYSSQQISISSQIVEDFIAELDYLSSERIIKREGSQLQFFHQTFYDFLFAKYFTAKRLSIMSFIRDSGQSIMIRSGLKMILNFTRETNNTLYEQYLRQILGNNSLHFHVKHLLITLLSVEQKPTENEKKIFSEIIAKEYNFMLIFLEQVLSREWIIYLIDSHFLELLTLKDPAKGKYAFDPFVTSFLPSSKKRAERLKTLSEIMVPMLKRNMALAEREILTFCNKIDDLSNVIWLLFNVKDWHNKTAVKLFEKCFPLGHSDHHGFYMIIEQLVFADPNYAFEKIKSKLSMVDEERKNNLRNNASEKLLKQIAKVIPDVFIAYAHQVIIDEGKTLPKEGDSGIIRIYNAKDILKKKANFDNTANLYKLLALALKDQADQQSPAFGQYLKANLYHRHDSILKLLVFALLGNEEFYKQEILALFYHLKNENGLSYYDDLNEGLRRLLTQAIPFLCKNEMTGLANATLEIRNPGELKHLSQKKPTEWYYARRFDYTKYKYLCCLPAAIRDSHAELRLAYSALYEKFGSFTDLDQAYFGPARGPISDEAYQKMSLKHWMRSFQKYNNKDIGRNSLRGGLYEHAEKFGEIVKKDPGKYDELIRETVFNPQIHIAYTIKALQALEANSKELPNLLKQTFLRGPKGNDLYYIVQIAQKLISKGEYVDKDIFDFVLSASKPPVKPDVTDPEDGYYRNEVHAQERAIEALVHVKEKALAPVIFDRLENAILDSEESIFKIIMRQSAYLLSLDEKRTVELFVQHMDKLNSAQQINPVCWNLQYLVHRGFDQFKHFFTRAISITDESGTLATNLSNILISCCYNRYVGAEDIFWRFFKQSPEAKSSALSTAFEHFYWGDDVRVFNLRILFSAIQDDSKKVKQRFKVKFLHIDHISFEDIQEWLFAYTRSKSFVFGDYFVEYLINNSPTDTKACIDLFELAMNNKEIFKDKESNEIRSDENTTKFIIGAYNALPTSEYLYRKKLLKMFDTVLLNVNYRRNAENMLEKMLE